MIDLRGYQTNIVNEARELMTSGCRSMLICSPTGSGKTALTAHMLGVSASKSMRSWFIVHRRELIKQSMRAFDKQKLYHGIIANGFIEDSEPKIQICSIDTLRNRIHKTKPPKLIVWDECHHLGAKSWEKIYHAFPKSFHIGLTATPVRLDGKGLSEYFDEIILGPSVRNLIDDGYLSDYKLFAPSSPNLTGVHKRMGDYVTSELKTVMDRPTITGNAITEYKRRGMGKRAVIFCVSIEHSMHVVNEFNRSGIRATHVDGETDTYERDKAIAMFESGEIDVLSNVGLFGEGFDLPAIEVCILLRPTMSLGLYLQMVGRALRPSPGKDHAIILDHAGNAENHGLPCEDRQWNLNGIPKNTRDSDSQIKIKTCPACYAVQKPGPPKCQFCGFEFPKDPRVVAEVDGDLQEIDVKLIRQKKLREQASAQSEEDLYKIGVQRGYKHARRWAKYVFQSRQAKRMRG